MVQKVQDLIKQAYFSFNARDIDAVLKVMHPEVNWSNGWEGGYVKGHHEVSMTLADRIVTNLPLQRLWNFVEEMNFQRSSYLSKEGIQEILKGGPVRFVVQTWA